jgi:hypothetical protein
VLEWSNPVFSLGISKQIKSDDHHSGFQPNLGAGFKVKLRLRIHDKSWVKIEGLFVFAKSNKLNKSF